MKKKIILNFILNIVIVLSTLVAVGWYFVAEPDILGSTGARCLRYFTTDSNLLAAAGSLVMVVLCAKRMKNPAFSIPRWAVVLKFVGTVSVTITLLTVIFFLAPVAWMKNGIDRFFFFFRGNVFVLHLSTPVLALVSLLCFERGQMRTFRDALWGLVPTVAYSILYFIMVVIVERWTDWYGFTFGGKVYMIPISVASMYLVTLGVSALLWKLGKKQTANRS